MLLQGNDFKWPENCFQTVIFGLYLFLIQGFMLIISTISLRKAVSP